MSNSFMKDFEEMVKKSMIHHVDGQAYSSCEMYRITDERSPNTLECNTLSSIKTYLDMHENKICEKNVFIHIENHCIVSLMTEFEQEIKKRICLVKVTPNNYECFRFGYFNSVEEFIIRLSSQFVQNEDSKNLIQFASHVTDFDEKNVSDDGITQNVIVKKGLSGALKDTSVAPKKVYLMPCRIFPELEQPESPFLFRMKEERGEIRCALFECDGGYWTNQAINNIRDFLEKDLEKAIPIIS